MSDEIETINNEECTVEKAGPDCLGIRWRCSSSDYTYVLLKEDARRLRDRLSEIVDEA